MSKQIVITFPTDLPEVENKRGLKKAKEVIVMELLRQGRISHGKAAELLEISRNELFDIMVRYNMPMADFPPEELQRQREDEKKAEEEIHFASWPLKVKGKIRRKEIYDDYLIQKSDGINNHGKNRKQ